ncbi:hypothetical protein A6R68_02160, partial [Neotoma lepida]
MVSQWWEQHTRFSHEARHLDPWHSVPAVEKGAFLLQTKENWREEVDGNLSVFDLVTAQDQSTPDSASCSSTTLQHKCWHTALKKWHTKENKEAAEHAKLLAKRMKKTPGTNCQQ